MTDIKQLIEIMKKSNPQTVIELIGNINTVNYLLSGLNKDFNSNKEVMSLSKEICDISNIIIERGKCQDVDKYLTECIIYRLESIKELLEQNNCQNSEGDDDSIAPGTMRIITAIREYVESHNSTDAINAYYKEHGTYKGLDEYLKTIE